MRVKIEIGYTHYFIIPEGNSLDDVINVFNSLQEVDETYNNGYHYYPSKEKTNISFAFIKDDQVLESDCPKDQPKDNKDDNDWPI